MAVGLNIKRSSQDYKDFVKWFLTTIESVVVEEIHLTKNPRWFRKCNLLDLEQRIRAKLITKL